MEEHKIAFGFLRLTPYQYYTLTPYEYYCTLQGTIEDYKRRERSEWERSRLIAYMVYGLGAGKEAKPIEQFLPLEGDNISAPLSVAEKQAIFKQAMKTSKFIKSNAKLS